MIERVAFRVPAPEPRLGLGRRRHVWTVRQRLSGPLRIRWP
jgi:hypothetical protein